MADSCVLSEHKNIFQTIYKDLSFLSLHLLVPSNKQKIR